MKVSKVQSVSEELRTQHELVNAGFHWRWAFVGWDFAARAEAAEALFAGQAIVFGGTALLCLAYAGRRQPLLVCL